MQAQEVSPTEWQGDILAMQAQEVSPGNTRSALRSSVTQCPELRHATNF